MNKSNEFLGRFLYSRFANLLARIPPISWLVGKLVLSSVQQFPRIPAESITEDNSESIFAGFTRDLVSVHGFTAAIVATFERGDTLPVRAFYIDPNIVSLDKIRDWEMKVSQFSQSRISLTDPEIAKVYVHKAEYYQNISVQAARSRQPVISDKLFDLFTPIVPQISSSIIHNIQVAIGIKQIVAFPLFLEAQTIENDIATEYIGNLVVAKRSQISQQDLNIFSSYSRQIALAIRSEQNRVQTQMLQELMFATEANMSEDDVLGSLAERVALSLGYAVAIIYLNDKNDGLTISKIKSGPTHDFVKQVANLEILISKLISKPFSFSDPQNNTFYLYQKKYAENLGVKAAALNKPIISKDLFDVFIPIIPNGAKELLFGIQKSLGIESVAAIPLYDGQDYLGNLVVASQSNHFNRRELESLMYLCRQQAFVLRNIRLYNESKERRNNARALENIVFNSVTSLHALNNLIGKARTTIQLADVLKDEQKSNFLKSSPSVLDYLDAASDIMNNLRVKSSKNISENISNTMTDVNSCLVAAINKILRRSYDGLHTNLQDGLPNLYTSAEKLTEAFAIIVKNALDAIEETNNEPQLWIESEQMGDTSIRVQIRDNGIGIKHENIHKIFELGWTTKKSMGLGLFWVKDYVEDIGGQIMVNSIWQKGTEIQMTFPITSSRLRKA